MTRAMQTFRFSVLTMSLGTLMVLWGCGGSGDDDVQTTATRSEPPTVPAATAVPTLEPVDLGGGEGKYDGVTYVVSEGSEATFTVEEQLVRLPLPNDAVMRTAQLSGEVHLDGRASVVSIDLQALESDQPFRDTYVRSRMFGEHPTATFTVPDIGDVPEGLAAGEEIMTEVSGSLEVRGGAFPLEFEIEARDDAEVLYVLGRTTFTWDQLNIPRPTARSVASVEDEVRVEILLALAPEDG